MATIPKALQQVIDALGQLPGVGPRTAERYALSLLRSDPQRARTISDALGSLHDGVSYCQKTFAFTEPTQSISPLYSDKGRNTRVIIVVEDPFDVIAIEKIGQFDGTYHVLGGLLSPIDGIGPEQLRIAELFARLDEDKVEELILATNASVEGESTALYIQRQLNDRGSAVKLTRLARGIPVGVDIEYTDQLTLTRALEHRQDM
jgi:recombination protein RecR